MPSKALPMRIMGHFTNTEIFIQHVHCIVMAFKEVFVLFAFFFCSTSATYCSYSTDCGFGEKCCWDSVCRETCGTCYLDSQCGSGECCDSDGDCYTCSLQTPAIVGIVVGCLVVSAIVISIVACFCCACCPYYRYRHPGTVIVGAPATGYQQFVTTTSTQQTIPPPVPQAYAAQPPPYYPPQQAGPYPPPQVQGMAQYPPPQAKGPWEAQAIIGQSFSSRSWTVNALNFVALEIVCRRVL